MTTAIALNENWTAFRVDSDSGNTYTVNYGGCGEQDGLANLWECDCPAGRRGRPCKHVEAVSRWIDKNS